MVSCGGIIDPLQADDDSITPFEKVSFVLQSVFGEGALPVKPNIIHLGFIFSKKGITKGIGATAEESKCFEAYCGSLGLLGTDAVSGRFWLHPCVAHRTSSCPAPLQPDTPTFQGVPILPSEVRLYESCARQTLDKGVPRPK